MNAVLMYQGSTQYRSNVILFLCLMQNLYRCLLLIMTSMPGANAAVALLAVALWDRTKIGPTATG
jgi:hypothetical protein